MTSHSSPHAAAIADKLARRNERAFRLQSMLQKRGAALARIFIQDAILLWRFKREELWREVGAVSFDAWVADPDNKQESASKVHLQIQVIETCWRYFEIDRTLLYGVGYRKLQILMPEIELYRQYIGTHYYAGLWDELRLKVIQLIHSAQTLTVSALETLLIDNSIAYSGDGSKDASTPLVGGHTGRYETILDNIPMRVGNLRHEMSREDLLSWLGVGDMRDDDILYVRTARPRPKD